LEPVEAPIADLGMPIPEVCRFSRVPIAHTLSSLQIQLVQTGRDGSM
jgi:hypothetical protein